jgi:hypothetical protein
MPGFEGIESDKADDGAVAGDSDGDGILRKVGFS